MTDPGASTWATALVAPAVIAAVVAAVVSLVTVWWTGRREERQRRRELFAEAFATYAAYKEFPYVIRRRRHDRSEEERLRISEALRAVQERLSFFEAWTLLEAPGVGEAFRKLVAELRRVAGGAMRDAWTREPITEDSQMNIPDVDLSPLRGLEDAYLAALVAHLHPGARRRLISLVRRKRAR